VLKNVPRCSLFASTLKELETRAVVVGVIVNVFAKILVFEFL